MKKQKRWLSLFVVFVLIVSTLLTFLVGCSSKTENITNQKPSEQDNDKEESKSEEDETEIAGKGLYSNIDLSKPYTVHMYVLGDVPADMDLVLEEINKILQSEFNTTLQIHFLAWSDYQTKYSLILAGGEDVDLIYTSSWCYYFTEAAKGAFMEITDEFLSRAMPQTKERQIKESWEQVKINGKIFAVPRNTRNPEANIVVIRGDLREKYGLEPLTDWDSFEKYLITIAEKETPNSGIWGIAASQGVPIRRVWEQQFQIVDMDKGGTFPHHTYIYKDDKPPAPEDFFLYWDSQYFRDFVKEMKYLREKGVWPEDALTNTVSPHDAFANGKGAATSWNFSVFNYGKQVEQNIPGAKAEYYDITADKVVFPMPYVNDCFAIAAASKNPDRAGMVLDLLKNDRRLYLLIQGGIEGKHYINIENKYYEPGPDADKYPWNAFAWGLNDDELHLERRDRHPREIEIEEGFKKRLVDYPTNGFVFDPQPVKNEIAAVDAIRDEYLPMLELGLVDDVDATIDEMVARMKEAGVETIREEGLRQYKQWLDTISK